MASVHAAAVTENISHVLEGIYLWEFVTAMDFEWKYVTAKRKFKWPLLLYSTCRVCALGFVICNFKVSDMTHAIGCGQWDIWNLIFIFASSACASVLITLRVVAIWSYNYIVTAVTIGMCITNIGFLLFGVLTLRSKWSNISRSCTLENKFKWRYNVTASTVTDIAQLIIMFVGLWRSRQEKRGFIHYLYIQGFIWVVTATLVETPTAVFMDLNLHYSWNMLFGPLSFYAMIICATRMYRGLIVYDMDLHEHSHGPNVITGSSFQIGAHSRNGTSTGTGPAAPPTDSSGGTFSRTKDLGISLAENVARVGDEEAQSPAVPSLPSS